MSTKPFSCLLCPKTYLTRKSLLAHETKKHPHNHVVPHSLGFELPSNLKQFTLHCPKNLFYYVFHQELGFEYQPAQRKYKCIYKGRDGYQRIGYIFAHPDWGKKKTKVGSEVKVMTEKKDPETKQMVEVEFKFFWEE
ncbi:15330_t:CDS:2 [Gigaspora margarita]|uniref:15330_t:CDS:1 n=1 Tax=Gigaspora margarita TaxID=4874 RepID=A0ABN7VG41_GIGMA|nr:15330_t:CDS:2 [Gigaspora margarita]